MTAVPCALCREPVTLGEHRIVNDGTIVMAVVDPPGTFWPHLRDAHPGAFAEAVERRERLNATLAAIIGAMPRKVDGTFLRPGEAVGDVA